MGGDALPMSRLGRVALVLLVLALVVVGLPVGMPTMSCPQCVLPVGAWCLLVALLTAAVTVVAPNRTGGPVSLLALRLQAQLWARRVERPPQRLPQPT
jgi:hypothetical protein